MQQAVERSRGGVTTKIHTMVDAPKLVGKTVMADRGMIWIISWI